MMSNITLALDAQNHLGETPIWSAREQALYWVNCEHPPQIHRLDPASGQHDSWEMPARVGGFAPKASGGLLVALASGLHDFAPDNAALNLRVATPLPDHVKLHECHCDRQGRFWIGAYDHHYPADRDAAGGFWFRLDGDRLTPVIDQVTVANGLAFSPDGHTMYASKTKENAIEAFDLDPASGALSNRRLFCTVPREEGFCDGATVDSEGGYWLATVGHGLLRRYWPDGSLDRLVQMPCSNPTKLAFGGADLATLYVTSTQLVINPDAPGNSRNGGLFAFKPGERGIAETDFAG
jgi:L-arabinonolactonase